MLFHHGLTSGAVDTDGRLALPRHTMATRLAAARRRLSAMPYRGVSANGLYTGALKAVVGRPVGIFITYCSEI
jgi:hypothetical protein